MFQDRPEGDRGKTMSSRLQLQKGLAQDANTLLLGVIQRRTGDIHARATVTRTRTCL